MKLLPNVSASVPFEDHMSEGVGGVAGSLTIDRTMQAADPITRGNGVFDSSTNLAMAELCICTSFLAFAQSVRLHVHVVSHACRHAASVAAKLGREK